jgi:hypothetical protein
MAKRAGKTHKPIRTFSASPGFTASFPVPVFPHRNIGVRRPEIKFFASGGDRLLPALNFACRVEDKSIIEWLLSRKSLRSPPLLFLHAFVGMGDR